jgi:hypothetical protein
MSISPAVLVPTTALAAAAAAIYTVPANGQSVVKSAVFTNIDTVTRTITVHRVPSGGSVTTANMMVSAYRLSPGQDYTARALTNLVLNAGDAIHAFADSANKVNVTVSGFTA